MSETNGRIDYGRLLTDIDYAGVFEGTDLEQYTDTGKGLGSTLGGFLGASLGRFVGMALGQVAQELVVDELFGTGDDEETEDDTESPQADTDEQTEAESEQTEAENEQTAEADAE